MKTKKTPRKLWTRDLSG